MPTSVSDLGVIRRPRPSRSDRLRRVAVLILATCLLAGLAMAAARLTSTGHHQAGEVTLSRTFEAAGGPVVVTVTVTDAGPYGCPVALVDGAGAVLATGRAGAGPLVLRGRALAPKAPFRLELRARRGVDLGWQATIGGATG